MPRPPRLDFPGAVHHVMNRGARRAAVFAETWVCQLFLEVLAELPTRFNVRILAYAILPNHYHLLLECPDGNLSRAMQYLGSEFTQRLNRRQAWDGPIFRGRFLSRLVDGDAYFAHVYAYIHLNPVRAGLAPTADAARWTSHRAHVGLERRPSWLTAGVVERLFGSRSTYQDYLAACQSSSPPNPTGWDPEHLWRPADPPPTSPARPAAFDVPRLLADVANLCGVAVAALREPRSGRRGNPARALAAWWLGVRTTLTNGQIGEHVGCSAARVSQLRRQVPRRIALAPHRTALTHPNNNAFAEPPLVVCAPAYGPPAACDTGPTRDAPHAGPPKPGVGAPVVTYRWTTPPPLLLSDAAAGVARGSAWRIVRFPPDRGDDSARRPPLAGPPPPPPHYLTPLPGLDPHETRAGVAPPA